MRRATGARKLPTSTHSPIICIHLCVGLKQTIETKLNTCASEFVWLIRQLLRQNQSLKSNREKKKVKNEKLELIYC